MPVQIRTSLMIMVDHCEPLGFTIGVPAMLTDESGVYLPEDLPDMKPFPLVYGYCKVVLFDCDDFTQKFYKESWGAYLGYDQRANRMDVSEKPVTHLKLTPPPHNGVGREEDSLISTQMINVKADPVACCRKLAALKGEPEMQDPV
eukprot:Skav208646  [mRNA]  locus=scaffold1081:196036:207751:- [translate_table: standard]